MTDKRLTAKAPVRLDFAGGWTDVEEFAHTAHGHVVSATIDRYVTGTRATAEDGSLTISYQSDLPVGCGLGASAALNVVWLNLVRPELAERGDKAAIAEMAYGIEQALGIIGGKQDQYASAFGGFNSFRFDERVTVERLNLQPAFLAELERRLVLCYTGKSRLSSTIHEDVWGAYRRAEPATVEALHELRIAADVLADALLREDIGAFATLLDKNWQAQKRLHPSVTNGRIDTLFKAALKHGAVAGKACGAGGGGCLLFLARPSRAENLRLWLERCGASTIPFHFEFCGLQTDWY